MTLIYLNVPNKKSSSSLLHTYFYNLKKHLSMKSVQQHIAESLTEEVTKNVMAESTTVDESQVNESAESEKPQ